MAFIIKNKNRNKGTQFTSSDIEFIKKIYTDLDMDSIFVDACKKGYLDKAKMIDASEQISFMLYNKAFIGAASFGHYDVANWLYSTYKIMINSDTNEAFIQNCLHNNIEMCHWLYYDVNCQISIHTLCDMFRFTCRSVGDRLCMATWLYSLVCDHIDVYRNECLIFRNACYNGNLHIVKWLHDLYHFNIRICKDACFKISCINGYMYVAQWLCNLDGNVVKSIDNRMIARMCERKENRHANLEWVQSISFGQNIDINIVFKIACVNNELDTAKWLCDKYSQIDKNRYKKDIIHKCNKEKYYDMMAWIQSPMAIFSNVDPFAKSASFISLDD